jgi:hypothetical protein
MKPNIYLIQIRVYTNEMMKFFSEDPSYGTKEKPYPADSFSQLISPYAVFYGPLKNILLFQNNSNYRWVIESADGKPLAFTSKDNAPEMDMVMITDKPSDAKWEKIFPKAPKMKSNGKVVLKSKNTGDNIFEIETSDDVKNGGKLKYSFTFEFENEKGELKYGTIDPHGDTYPPPLPPGLNP